MSARRTKLTLVVAGILIGILFPFFITQASSVATVACVVKDVNTGQPLEGALCGIGFNIGFTNSDGYVAFDNISLGTHVIDASKVGYRSYSAEYTITGNTDVHIDLTPLNPTPPPPSSPERQDIDYTINDNIDYYNVAQSGHRTFNWNVDLEHRGPGGMHVVTIGHHDDESGSAPTVANPFPVHASGKLAYRNPPETGSFSFPFDTRDWDCGRVQIDGSFIDERYEEYNDDFLFFAIVVDYGVDCGSEPPPPPPSPPSPPPSDDNNASCVGIAAPDTVSPGQTFWATITMRNTGNTTWTFNGEYKLGSQSPQDNGRWGIGRVHLDGSVPPNSNKSFATNFTAPTTPGTYDFDWRMVEENVEWFGQSCDGAITVESDTPPPPPPPPPSCEIPSKPGMLFFGFSDKGLRSDRGESEATETISASIPAGNYKVTLQSYDSHTTGSHQTQPNEQYFVRFLNGGEVTRSHSISDLPDNQNTLVEVVNHNLSIPGNVSSLEARHAAWLNSNANSIVPICIGLEPISIPPPPPANCDSFGADPTSITQGGSSTLTWETTNAVSVSINQGIGVVNDDGSTNVSPSVTTTYTLTAVGVDGSTDTCSATINVGTTPPPASCDAFSASPPSINSGGSSTLTWATTNATSVSINQGIGSVSNDGSTSVSPTFNTTYILTAVGAGGNDTCSATVTVNQPNSPSCALSLSPTSIVSGSSATLSWTTTNVASASIDQGIGGVALPNSSHTVMPTSDTTYTMTAIGNNGQTITCDASLTVTTPAPQCSLTANPSSISPGGSTTLEWTTNNATSAEIDQGIGSVTPVPAGTEVVNGINTTTTYTLTATGAGGTVVCPATVTVSTTPLADVSIEKSVTPASAVKGSIFIYTLIYRNTGNLAAENSTIEDKAAPSNLVSGYTITKQPDHGSCTANSDGISCSLGTLPAGSSGTIEYKVTGIEVGTVNNTAVIETTTPETTLANNQDSAQISIFTTTTPPCTTNCGGGHNPPTVVMLSKPGEDRPFASQSFIYLSQIPYTGIATNPKIILFVIFLSLWSALAAYFIIKRWKGGSLVLATPENILKPDRRVSFEAPEEEAVSIGEIIEKEERPKFETLRSEVIAPELESLESKAQTEIKQKPFVGANLPIEGNSQLGKIAKERGVLISDDAASLLSSIPNALDSVGSETLNLVLNAAGTMYPRDDGWIILDKKRLEQILFSSQFNVISIFAEWLSVGESTKIFAFLRLLRNHELSVKSFLKKVAYYIDNLYRCRIGESLDESGKIIDPENKCTNWSTRDIQKVVSILVNGVDESYDSEDASVKLALVKILEISDRAKVEGKSYYNA